MRKLIPLLILLAFAPHLFALSDMKGEVMAYQWTGFYAGLNVGAVNHTMNVTDVDASSFNATLNQVSNPSWSAGLQLGYRRALDFTAVSGVYGLELSTNFSNADFDKTYGSPFALYHVNMDHALKNVSLLELTGGIAANRTLVFLAAGVSWVHINGDADSLDGAPFFNTFSFNHSTWGTALGGGIEYGWMNNISIRLKVDVITPNTYSTTDDVSDTFQIANSIVQGTLGLNYRFG